MYLSITIDIDVPLELQTHITFLRKLVRYRFPASVVDCRCLSYVIILINSSAVACNKRLRADINHAICVLFYVHIIIILIQCFGTGLFAVGTM